MLTDPTVGVTRPATTLVVLYQRAILLTLKLIGCWGHLHRCLLCLLEELVVVEWVDSRLRFDFNVECTVIILLTHAYWIHIAIDGHQGSQRIAKRCIIPVMLNLFD